MFPTATGEVQKKLAAVDAADIAPPGSDIDIVKRLRSVAAKTDPVIDGGLGQAMAQGHFYKNVKALKKTKVLYGDEIGKDSQNLGFRNTYVDAIADDEAQVQYGNRVNMDSFWK